MLLFEIQSLNRNFRRQVSGTNCDIICEEKLVDCLVECDINDNSCYRDCLRQEIQCLEGLLHRESIKILKNIKIVKIFRMLFWF